MTEKSTTLPLSVDLSLFKSELLQSDELVKEFYRQRNLVMVWSDSGGRSAAADSMITFIHSVKEHGLLTEDYHLPEINQLTTLPLSHENAVALDFYLSDAFFTLWHHLHEGRVDPKTFVRADLARKKEVSAIASLIVGLEQNSFREELEKRLPQTRQYNDLQRALRLSPGTKPHRFIFPQKKKQIDCQPGATSLAPGLAEPVHSGKHSLVQITRC